MAPTFRTAALFLCVTFGLVASLRAQSVTNVTVTNPNTRVVGTTTIASSSRLTVSWTAPAGSSIDHYEVRAVESGAITTLNVASSQTAATLTELKSSTTYTITVRSCADAGCVTYTDSSPASGTTAAEYWQVQGTGNSASTATIVIAQSNPQGSVMAWPVLFGAEAGVDLQGKVQLYFKGGVNGLNSSTGLSGTATAAPSSVSNFTHDANYGLRNPSPGLTLINTDVSAPQAIPRSVGGTRHVRLFFKAVGTDLKNRLFYFDSQDGLVGKDFHPGAPTVVSTPDDWAAASPTVALGVTGDTTAGDSGLTQVRQTKIGLPLRTNWLWDDAPGTFMVITGRDDCGQTEDGLFYAQFDGTRWNVARDVAQCARPLVRYAHGPVLLHRGGTRYKMYYEDRVTNLNNTLKPIRMLYGDGAFSGSSALEFEDWESQAAAREIHFLWPDGTPASVAEESGFGDHAVFYPTADADVQFMYMNITGNDGTVTTGSAGIGMAVLINDLCPDYMTASRSTNECAPAISANPEDRSANLSSTATFSVAATGSPVPTYQWQVSSDNGSTWTNLSNTVVYGGVTTPVLRVVGPTSSLNGRRYRAIATNAAGSATSAAATLTVTATLTARPAVLRFAATRSGAALQSVTSAQTVAVTFDGAGASWTATASESWLQVSGGAGASAGLFTVQIVPGAVPSGSTSLSGSVTIAAAGVANSPVTVPVTLSVATAISSPFGAFDTPASGATVAGSVAVTGWALDDVEVTRVELWRDRVAGETTPVFTGPGPGNGKIFIATPFFVDGARPDVEAAYSTTPFAHRAGWGYLLLTYGLWNQGNGSYTLYAFAFDAGGRSTTLGTKSITGSNATATRPFGSIDTPSYGQTVTSSLWNFGWALTPNASPACTIGSSGVQVSIDSGPLTSVAYGALRSDIAAAFPGYSNGGGAGGAYYLDISTLSNGTHQIGWYIVDSCNRAEGVGSRFFNVVNASSTTQTGNDVKTSAVDAPLDSEPIDVRRGSETTLVSPSPGGTRVVAIRQGERIAIHLPAAGVYAGYQLVNGHRRALPLGSSLDAASGIFYWEPGTAFLGAHDLEFVAAGERRVLVRAVIGTSVQAAIDLPLPGPVGTPFVIAGWAIDEAAIHGSGIDTVHVWAYPVDGRAPKFLGVASYGDKRVDIEALFGAQFAGASYTLVVPGLPPGSYDIVVYPHSAVAGDFHGAKAVRVVVH